MEQTNSLCEQRVVHIKEVCTYCYRNDLKVYLTTTIYIRVFSPSIKWPEDNASPPVMQGFVRLYLFEVHQTKMSQGNNRAVNAWMMNSELGCGRGRVQI